MIGNDIVDLNAALKESNWQRKGFLAKVFTNEEQLLILNSKDPFKTVWLLWSMKESAYKVYVQEHLQRFFAPKKLVCSLTSFTSGFVMINGNKYQTKSTLNNTYIYTEAVLKSTKKEITNNCFFLEDSSAKNQRNVTYNQLKHTISNIKQLPFKNLEIKKTIAGIPKIYQNNKRLPIPFSITHHGNYGAISILN